jgi:hypothetical protein
MHLELVASIGFERARLQPCRKNAIELRALATEGCLSATLIGLMQPGLEKKRVTGFLDVLNSTA